ncbi:guanylate kinase [Egibacter rhizosphaerae]|uniref:guanylate kinase n=1 Tax=Egibacter rhizosphaerae TaxID=1670831 RepID=UPI0023EA7164|nr:guanylate kinase [Egibacter rhizosphaerae]
MVSGPGGVGKGTVVAQLRAQRPDVAVSVSATTRAPRPHERDGVDYWFLDPDAFTELVEAGGFLEWAEFGGDRYGTPWSSVAAARADGGVVLLEIEVQGALQVRDRFEDAVLVFLCPPDDDALVARLRQRGTDPPERIAERMAIARWELAQAERFDIRITNDELAATVDELASILDVMGTGGRPTEHGTCGPEGPPEGGREE